MCKKKKNVQLFWVCFGVWRGRDIFYFLFQFLCIDFHNSSKAGTVGLGVGEGSFWNVNLGLLKKVRTASDKFITRLNLIMSCSRALSPLSPSLHLPSLLPSVFLCFFNKHTDSSTLRCSPENCEVHVHSDVTKKDVTPHFLKNNCGFSSSETSASNDFQIP